MYICSTQVFFILKQNLKTIFSYVKQSWRTFDSVHKLLKILST